jgi:hypothetical protein
MPDYEIKIKTTAEGDGARRAADDLQKLKTGAAQTAATQKDLTKETDTLTISKGKLAAAVTKLTTAFPALGVVASAVRHPLIGLAAVIALGIQALQKFKNTFEDVKGAVSAGESITKVLFGMSGAAGSAARELEGFNTALDTMATKGKTAADQVNAALEAIRKLDEMETEKRSAEEAVEIARIHQAEAGGQLSRADAIRARAGVKDKFAGLRDEALIRRAEQEQEARQEALRRTQERRLTDEEALPDAVQAAAEAERRAGGAPEKEKVDRESIGKRRAAIAERLDTLYAKRRSKRTNEVDDEINRLNDEKLGLAKWEAEVAAERKAAEQDARVKSKRADDLKKGVETGRDTEGKLFEQIITGDQALGTLRRHRRAVGGKERQARGIEAEKVLALLARYRTPGVDLDALLAEVLAYQKHVHEKAMTRWPEFVAAFNAAATES